MEVPSEEGQAETHQPVGKETEIVPEDGLVFISEELEFELDPNLANYILPKGSFFSKLKDFSLRDRQDILERYPPPEIYPDMFQRVRLAGNKS